MEYTRDFNAKRYIKNIRRWLGGIKWEKLQKHENCIKKQ